MADVHYYVSQQRGNDANDGLSPTSPWATLAKANAAVAASPNGDVYINIGPGVYRERLVLANAGIDATHRIIWRGDPDAIRVRGDKPGQVRITGANANETPTAGHIINWNGKQFVEFWEVQADGSSDLDAFYMGAAIDKTVACRHCTGIGYVNAFCGGSAYCCIGESRSRGFSYCAALQCIATGYYGYSYCEADLCLALGCYYGYHYGTARGCLAVGCPGGYSYYYCTDVCSVSLGTNNPSSVGATHILLAYNYGPAPILTSLLRGQDVYRVGPLSPYLMRRGLGHNWNWSTAGTPVILVSERFYAFTPSEAGVSLGVAVNIYTLGSAQGSLVAELQKKVGGVWTTQRSVTVPWNQLATGWRVVYWDTGAGDAYLTPVADTWRFRFTSTTNDGRLSTSDNTLPSCVGLFWPDSWPAEDFDGKPRHQGDYLFMAGPFQPQMEELDWAVYHTYAPSLKLSRRSSAIFTLAANCDVPLTVKVWVKHVNTAGDKPVVRLRGLDITEQVAVCTAPNDTWQELTLQATPTLSGVLEVVFEARDPAEGAASWFELSGVS